MKPRLSLPIKILLLAVTNLLFLLAIAIIFLSHSSRLSWDSLLLAPSEDRILSSARLLALELQRTPLSQQDALLANLSHEFGVEAYLFRNDGQQVAGKPIQLPEEVLHALGGPPPRDFPEPRDLPDAPGQRPPVGDLPDDPLFHVKTTQPARHWIGVHIPIRSSDTPELVRGVVLFTADSWFSGSLFFDFRPWLFALAAVFLVTLLCWAPFLRNLTRSIRQLTVATERIAEGQFDVQLHETRLDELGQLSQAIQRMATRLSQLVNGQKRFLGDVAHELCSPIARIQFALGILQQRIGDATLEDLHEEVQHMSSLVQELLQFSKASIQNSARPLESVNLAESAQSAAEREAIPIQMEIDPMLRAQADSAALNRALSNLIRNASRYAGAAGPIQVSASRQDGQVRIVVSDHGPGLPEEEFERVMSPFYRPELARTREGGGVGLGLAIVKSCVEACQGTVRLRNRQPHGLEVEITLKSA
jgi:two-component system sensor histidine kinase CpxA